MTYPDYVKRYRPKGTVVKYSNGTYYVYYAKSERVPGKSYPVQKIDGLAGKIDEFGFHPVATTQLNLDRVVIRECGFTNFLLRFEDEYIEQRSEIVKDARDIYRSIIVYFSNNSYLCDEKGTTIYSMDQLTSLFHVGAQSQFAAIKRLCEHDPDELTPLKYICNVRIDGHVFKSELTEPQKRLLEELGVTEDEIR